MSMLSSSMYKRLAKNPAILPFTNAVANYVNVCGKTSKIRNYYDLLLKVDGAVVHHPLIVVNNLAFSLFININILRQLNTLLAFCENGPLQIRNQICKVCCEQRTNLSPKQRRPIHFMSRIGVCHRGQLYGSRISDSSTLKIAPIFDNANALNPAPTT